MTVLNYHDGGIPDGAVFIGRPSMWGNPYPARGRRTRAEAIELYRRWLWRQIRAGRISLEELADLHGQDLVCFCKPKPCHGDVLERAAAWAARMVGREGVEPSQP